MIIKWKISWGSKIERVECTRETASSVFFMVESCRYVKGEKVLFSTERRAAQTTEEVTYFTSWEAAHSYLLRRSERGALDLRRQIDLADARIAKIKQMTAPVEVAK